MKNHRTLPIQSLQRTVVLRQRALHGSLCATLGLLALLLAVIYFSFGPYATAQDQTSSGSSQQQEQPDLARRRHEWFYGQRAYPQKRIPARARLEALEQVKQMLAAESVMRALSPGMNPIWHLIGPQPLGAASSPPDYVASGKVTALAVDPRNSNTVYLGAAEGGVWKTTDGGNTWTPLTDTQASLATGSIALDPSNPDTVYVGTGEADFADSYYGAGILKSTDGGTTWTHICGPFCGPFGGEPETGGAHIGAVAVHPTNGQILLAAVLFPDGISRSADGGSTWTQVLSVNIGNSVIFDPTDGNVAYASLAGILSPAFPAGIYKSTDAGQTWIPVNGSGASALPVANAGRIAITIAPSSPTTLYAGIANPDGTFRGVFKTTDGGSSWVQLTSAPDYCTRPQCVVDAAIAVQPTNPNVVYAGGAGFPSLVSSQDGGMTWAVFASGHPDTHALAFSADGSKLYVGNDGGAWSTNEVNASNPAFVPLNSTLAITQFYPGLSIDPTNLSIAIGGTQDNGTDLYSGALKWNDVLCGDGAYTAIDAAVPTTMYATCALAGLSISKSTAGGAGGTWVLSNSGITPARGEGIGFIPPLVMDPSRSSTLYFGTFRVYQTTDGANTWNPISPNLGTPVTTIAVAPTDSNTVYAGTCCGVQVTTNAGSGTAAIWTDRTAGLPIRFITQVAVDPGRSRTAYVTFTGFTGFFDNLGHVFKTTDGGMSWVDISGNLPNTPVNAIVTVPGAPAFLFVGTDVGVFYTSNAGASWATLVNGLPNVVVLGLALHNATHTLRASTHGRSVWDIDVANLLSPPSKGCREEDGEADEDDVKSDGGTAHISMHETDCEDRSHHHHRGRHR